MTQSAAYGEEKELNLRKTFLKLNTFLQDTIHHNIKEFHNIIQKQKKLILSLSLEKNEKIQRIFKPEVLSYLEIFAARSKELDPPVNSVYNLNRYFYTVSSSIEKYIIKKYIALKENNNIKKIQIICQYFQKLFSNHYFFKKRFTSFQNKLLVVCGLLCAVTLTGSSLIVYSAIKKTHQLENLANTRTLSQNKK